MNETNQHSRIPASLVQACLVLSVLLMISCAGSKVPVSDIEIGDSITHRVKSGDSWQSLAREYYADGSRGASIAEYNRLDPQVAPEPGTGIRIPMTPDDRRSFDRLVEASRYYNDGLELAAAGKYAEATTQFERALEIDPSFIDAAFNLGVTNQKLGMHQKAVEIVSGIDPGPRERPDILYALGASYFHLRQYDDAEDAFVRVLKVEPVHLKALYSLSVVYEKTGEKVKAAGLLSTYIENAPPGVWLDQAKARLKDLEG